MTIHIISHTWVHKQEHERRRTGPNFQQMKGLGYFSEGVFKRSSAYIAFDQDDNHAGQQASQQLARRLQNAGLAARIVKLPPGHDPNSYFAAGATIADFTIRLQQAHRL